MYTEASDSDAVAFSDFLSLARDEGLIAVEVQVIQAPDEGNEHTAVVQAIARTRDGGFGAVGEASPASAPAAWRPFLTTLAELRAKARALREMTGLEHAVQEELNVPYRVVNEGATGEKELPQARQVRSSMAAPTADGASSASATRDEPDEPVDIARIPGLQRGMGGIKFAPRTPPADPTPRPSDQATRPFPDQDEGDEMDDEDEGDERLETRAATSRVIDTVTSPAPASPPRQSDDDAPPDYDAVPSDMLDKLKRLAKSIAELEGTEISDAQALLKLDDFFMRAFRHPLGKSTRIEGQRVVQKLSSDLSKRRAEANAAHEDDA